MSRAVSIQLAEGGIELSLASASPELSGQTIMLAAYAAEDDTIAWDCTGGSLPAKYRPPHCRVP
jgi:hypothetical protein